MQVRQSLSNTQWCYRSLQLTEAFIPWLRERYPVGSVVIVNLLTAEFIVGENTPDAVQQYEARFGDADSYMQPVHG